MMGLILRDERRASDHVSRIGGEEFAILLFETSAIQATEVAERIRKRIEQTVIRYTDQELTFTASAGIAEIGSGELCRKLVSRADDALYVAKKAGRNVSRVHQDHLISSAVAVGS